jgi:hypothetical protein
MLTTRRRLGLDHVLAGMEIAGMRGTRQLDFLGRRQQRRGADLVQINLGDVLDETRIMQIRDLLGRVALGQESVAAHGMAAC